MLSIGLARVHSAPSTKHLSGTFCCFHFFGVPSRGFICRVLVFLFFNSAGTHKQRRCKPFLKSLWPKVLSYFDLESIKRYAAHCPAEAKSRFPQKKWMQTSSKSQTQAVHARCVCVFSRCVCVNSQKTNQSQLSQRHESKGLRATSTNKQIFSTLHFCYLALNKFHFSTWSRKKQFSQHGYRYLLKRCTVNQFGGNGFTTSKVEIRFCNWFGIPVKPVKVTQILSGVDRHDERLGVIVEKIRSSASDSDLLTCRMLVENVIVWATVCILLCGSASESNIAARHDKNLQSLKRVLSKKMQQETRSTASSETT